MRDAVIVSAVRTPLAKQGRRKPGVGKLANIRPDDLAALTLKEVVSRVNLDPANVDDVIMGCVTQIGEQGFNIARNAVLIAGFPLEVTGTSVNRQCGSSQQALHFAAQSIISGACDVVIAAGTESMTRVPMGSDGMVTSPNVGSPMSNILLNRFAKDGGIIPQGLSAEMVADKYQCSRQAIDELSFNSHQKAVTAIKEGRFKREIMPIEVEIDGADGSKQKLTFDTDETPRADTTLERLLSLKPVFKSDGVITAGNSSQISDGAAAILVTTSDKAKELGLKPRARVVAMALAGVHPTIMLTGPIPATEKVLKKAGLKINDIDVFEVNEAFATVVVAWQKEVGSAMEKVNINGGAVALGHPLGCSGARLITTALHELERINGKYALITMCIGFGQATATIIERI